MILLLSSLGIFLASHVPASSARLLNPESFAHYVQSFNSMEDESLTNAIPNQDSWAWMLDNVPFFECPDKDIETTYYFRWWSFRKHIVRTPQGFVFTEFLVPVSHAGVYNTISCAAGFHINEGRWLRDSRYVDDCITFWLRGNNGDPQRHFHNFSSWFAAAAWNRALVSGDSGFLKPLLPDLRADYLEWEKEHQLPDGLFWQFDVRDGMEESISGSRTKRNVRPTINSYMFANAKAIAALAATANELSTAREFESKAARLRELVEESLWDDSAKFFKVRLENGSFSSAREAIGFIPWMFRLPGANGGCEAAWVQLINPQGFRAPFGITTAERRHPDFRSHGIGTCEWDGAVWPFATSQTLCALANLLQTYEQTHIQNGDYFDAFLAYTRSHKKNGKPYIGEYMDEVTGDWIDGKRDRSAFYNHSLFADLLITGLVGLQPDAGDVIRLHPLLPSTAWDWFCLDQVKYHGRMLSIVWDREGTRYGRGPGLFLLADGKELARTPKLEPLKIALKGQR